MRAVVRFFLGSIVVLAVGLIILPFFFPKIALGQSVTGDANFNGGKYGYSLKVPTNWVEYDSEFTAYKGGQVQKVLITQTTDLVSRPTKYFVMYVGAPESVFGVSKKVVQKVTNDQLVDFYIDEMDDSSIDLNVTRTYVKDDGGNKIYVIEGNYAVPGYRTFTDVYIEFKNDKVYLWSTAYLNAFSNYATTLQQIVDSVKIQ